MVDQGERQKEGYHSEWSDDEAREEGVWDI